MRARFLVLALITTPFLTLPAQGRATSVSKKSESSVKRSNDREKQNQQKAQTCNSNNQVNQKGQHEGDDQECASKQPPPPPPAPPPPPVAALGQIHGTVYWDADKNFVMASYESGLQGFVVQLSGPVTASHTTDVTGTYDFTALPVGKYTVCVTPLAGWTQTQPATGPACGAGVGYSIDIPVTMPDAYWAMIDFGYWQ